MAKHIENIIVRFTCYTDLNGNTINDWRNDFLGLAGMLCIYVSEHKAPGKRFAYFYPNEPAAESQRYFKTSLGELSESDNVITFEGNNRYIFEDGDFISDDDKELLWLNVFANPNK